MEILAVVIIGILAANAVVMVLYPLVVCVINYIFRKQLNLEAFEDWKGDLTGLGDDVMVAQFVTHFIGGFLCFLGACIVKGLYGGSFSECMFKSFSYVSLFLLVCLSLPLARWLVDVSRNLKIKKSTGDSEKLAELQKQIDELKNK